MKELYLDIMEKALSAYSTQRIREYIDQVREKGLKEHGFPRLASNIGILIAYGRRTDLMDTFLEIMDLCCEEMPKRRAANEFSIREVCCCLMLLEEKQTVSTQHLAKWKQQLTDFDPWHFYNRLDDYSGRFITNWTLFAVVSDYMRGVYCGIDTTEFVEKQLPSQLRNLDEMGMYQDDNLGGSGNPIVYDLMPRLLFAFLLRAGYRGTYRAQIEEMLDKTARLTLQMQSVTGELPFGGRSNQFLINDAMFASYFELEAARFMEKGDAETAGEMKAAALLAAKNTLRYLAVDPISHIKNRYDIATKIGCEDYGYFNKYMITLASNIYIGFLFGDDSIEPTTAPAQRGGYVARTGESFHKTFLTAGGYHVELDTNADFHYDAKGVGRVHKAGCHTALCLAMPFPDHPNYLLEGENPTAMSICPFIRQADALLVGAEKYAQYDFLECKETEHSAYAAFSVQMQDRSVIQGCTVSEKGVTVTQTGGDGLMLPVFAFDGEKETEISIEKDSITVRYGGEYCRYRFLGEAREQGTFYNRNGRYRVFAVTTQEISIEMGHDNER